MDKITSFLFVVALGSIASVASAAQFSQCPSIGSNTGCAILITINNTGAPTISVDTSQGPYDSSDDTLVGVLNSSSSTVSSLPLASPTTDIFGFEGDGICSPGYGAAGNCTKGLDQGDPYDYTGDLVTFNVTDVSHGTVNFLGGLAPGASTYFSLEEDLSATDITPGPPTTGPGPGPGTATPEPATYSLLATGLAGCFWFANRRKRS